MRGDTHWLERHWYRRTPVSAALLPLAVLYWFVITLRRLAYRAGLLRRTRVPAPVIVVGNITVGGTGKTPLVVWMAQLLRTHGYRPGIITRGYGGRSPSWPQCVQANSDPAMVGDEPVSRMEATVSPSPLIFASLKPTMPDEFVNCANDAAVAS